MLREKKSNLSQQAIEKWEINLNNIYNILKQLKLKISNLKIYFFGEKIKNGSY